MFKAWPWLLLIFGIGTFGFVGAAQADARLVIIIDDIGYNQSQSERAARLDGAFTLSVLPFTPHGISSAQLAHQHGKELMLHLPMSTISHVALGKGALTSGMEKHDFLTTLVQDLNNIPHIQGVNNHMGSQLTQEAEPMQWLMETLRPRGLYFVDSRTSAKTKAFDIAKQYQVPSLKRDVFLDDVNEPKAIEYQLNRAIQFAQQRGTAVAIGHPYPNTLGVLERIQPILDKQQIRLVFASQLLKTTHSVIADTTKPNNSPLILDAGDLPYCPAPTQNSLIKERTVIDLNDKRGIMPLRIFGY